MQATHWRAKAGQQTSAQNIVTMDFVSIQAILAMFVARKSLGEDPRWTDYFWSWKIGSQVDKCLREQEQKLDNFISAGRISSGGGRLDPSWKSVCGRWTSCCHAVVSVRVGLKCIVPVGQNQ